MTITSSTAGVGEQLLERAEADRVAEDQVGDLQPPRRREDRGGLVDELADARLEIARRGATRGLGAAALDQLQAQLGGEDAGVLISAGDVDTRVGRWRSRP